MAFERGYKNYDRMVDICFWIIVGSAVLAAAHDAKITPATMLSTNWPLADALVFGLSAASKLGGLVLILMSRLRDEYAERLWRQAAGTYTKFIILSPVYWLGYVIYLHSAANGTVYLTNHPDALLLPLNTRIPNPSESVGIYQLEALNFVAAKLTGTLPMIFLGFYKWHRWRDSR